MGTINKLARGEQGQGMAEYGILLAGIIMIVIGAVYVFGGRIFDFYNNVTLQKSGVGT